jgi:aryl-alcohol dehydrogenase-like predicted oxidoreductase
VRGRQEISGAPSQVALAWVRQQTWDAIAPIVGAGTASQLGDDLGCLGMTLTAKQARRLDEASGIAPGFPGGFLKQVRQLVHGSTFDLIDTHRSDG